MKTTPHTHRKHSASAGRVRIAAGRTDLVALSRTVSEIRADSAKNGTDGITLNEINREISMVRASRRREPGATTGEVSLRP